jgi:hypothetical protein
MDIAPFAKARVLDATSSPFPSRLICLEREVSSFEEENSHFYGFVLSGRAILERAGLDPAPVNERMYFSCPAPFHLKCEGKVVIWERIGYRGLFETGGPVENNGRLQYIDGCTTTILCPPPRVLDPVLNLLCFPAGTKQTMHFHPTPRLGLVFQGKGRCVRPKAEDVPLTPGTIFYLEENLAHSFHTDSEEMHLIAFHPDSDTGPTDEDHPMLNRTYRIK